MIEGKVEVHAYRNSDKILSISTCFSNYDEAISYVERCSKPLDNWSSESTIWIIAPMGTAFVIGKDIARSRLSFWDTVETNYEKILKL